MVTLVKASPEGSFTAQGLLFVALAVATISQPLIYSILPPVGRLMGLSDFQISSIRTMSALGFAVASSILGAASERWGRLPFVSVGLVTGIVFNVLFAVTIEARLGGSISIGLVYFLLVLWRMCMSISWAGMFPATQAHVADTTPPERRTGVSAGFGVGWSASSTPDNFVSSVLKRAGAGEYISQTVLRKELRCLRVNEEQDSVKPLEGSKPNFVQEIVDDRENCDQLKPSSREGLSGASLKSRPGCNTDAIVAGSLAGRGAFSRQYFFRER